MKILTVPIISDRIRSEYTFGDNKILEKIYSLKQIEGIDEEKTEKEFKEYRLYDLSNIEEGKLYNSYDSIKNVKMVDDEVHFTLLDYVSHISEDEEIGEEYSDVEISDIEYPADAEVLTFEEVIFSEPEPDPVSLVVKENQELKKKVSQLESRVKVESETNTAMILELFNYVAQI